MLPYNQGHPPLTTPCPQVMGLRRQRNYAGRWDVLIQQATQCLNRLIQIAARKKRNYILDQVFTGDHHAPGEGRGLLGAWIFPYPSNFSPLCSWTVVLIRGQPPVMARSRALSTAL